MQESFRKEGLDVFTLKFNVTDEADVDKGVLLIEENVVRWISLLTTQG